MESQNQATKTKINPKIKESIRIKLANKYASGSTPRWNVTADLVSEVFKELEECLEHRKN